MKNWITVQHGCWHVTDGKAIWNDYAISTFDPAAVTCIEETQKTTAEIKGSLIYLIGRRYPLCVQQDRTSIIAQVQSAL